MAFDEVQLDPLISYGAKIGPTYSTLIVRTGSASEQRFQQWPVGIIQGDISYAITNRRKLAGLITFYRERRGMARGFRLKDHLDYSTDPYPQEMTYLTAPVQQATQSIDTLNFQLVKVYGTINPETRIILKPYTTTTCASSPTWPYAGIKVYVSGSEVTTGWTCDYTTGIVTFGSVPGGTVTWAGEFDVPVRFDTDLMEAVKEDFDIASWNGIKIMELLNPS